MTNRKRHLGRSELVRWLLALPRRTKRTLLLGIDLVSIPGVMLVAMSLKSGSLAVPSPDAAPLLLAAACLSVPVFARAGLYRAVLRFIGARVAWSICAGVAIVTSLLIALRFAGVLHHVDVSTLLIFGCIMLIYVAASRTALRSALTWNRAPRHRVAVYGAGDAGAELVSMLSVSRTFQPIAFVDDNPALYGTTVHGLEVSPPSSLPAIIRETGVTRVLLAMPMLSRRRRKEILDALQPLGVHVQTVPSIASIVSGAARVDDVQDVDAADLLGRDPVPPSDKLLGACIRGKVVLVSGAGGSIGSELCRQIVRLAPTRLLLVEMSELALYNIDRELRAIVAGECLKLQIVPLLGNAHHKYRMREIFQTFGVETVFHAAAYKHVPIVEQNMIEGLHNNVFSTWYAAEAALECGVGTFVFVSTDKAVNPTNVMGATKRFAEIVLQGMQQRGGNTRFCMVRFGNVLESSGSVIPLFREQIRYGGPVTVTHPDVIRYFMTIPEAAQLVIQAGAMAQGGDVFVLDMGKPIRIADLARRMIQLSGLAVRDEANPDGDIEIAFTGLRPAEKLFEELLIGKNVTGTDHPMIMRAVEHCLPWVEVQALLEEVGVAMRRFDCTAALELLRRVVAEYSPTGDIQDFVWCQRHTASGVRDSKVTELNTRRTRSPLA